MNKPYTIEELKNTIRVVADKLQQNIEEEFPDARPLPPMTSEEALMFLHRLSELAGTRALTDEERFLLGQLLACFKSAVRAETLGHKGRFFVISEKEISDIVKKL